MKNIKKIAIFGLLACGAFIKSLQGINMDIETAKKLAKESQTLKNMLQAFPETAKSIPMPSLKQEAINRVLILTENKPLNLAILDNQSLANLSKAISFLDIPKLEDIQKKIIMILADKTFGKNFKSINSENINQKIKEWQMLVPDDNFNNALLKPLIQKNPLYTLQEGKMPVSELAFSPDGTMLAIATSEGLGSEWNNSVTIINPQTHNTIKQFTQSDTPSKTFVSLAFNPNDTQLAITQDNKVTIWNTKTWEKESEINTNDQIGSIAFNSNNLATALNNKTIIWDTKTLNQIKQLDTKWVSKVGFSPDKTKFVTLTSGKAIIWNATTWKKINEINIRGLLFSLAFSPDNTKLAIVSQYSNIDIWDLKTDQLIKKLDHKGAVNTAFSFDGTKLAATSHFDTTAIWNTQTWQKTNELPGGNEALAFNQNGARLVTGDANVKIWVIAKTWQEALKILVKAQSKK